MSRSLACDVDVLNELQLLSDLHAVLDSADALGLSTVALRLEQAIAAVAEGQSSAGVARPSAEAT